MLPAPTAPSEGSAGLKDIFRRTRHQSPGSPAQASLPIVPLPRERSLDHLLDCAARKLACLSTSRLIRRSKQFDVLRPFLGPILSRPALLSTPKCFEPRRARKTELFRRLIPAGPASAPKSFSITGRRRSDLRSPAASSCRCRPSEEAGTAVPITCSTCTSLPSRESKKSDEKAVDNGDIGNNRRNLFELAICCPIHTHRLPPPSA